MYKLFLFLLSFHFPEHFCLFTCYIHDMFQRKSPFKDNKVLSYLNGWRGMGEVKVSVTDTLIVSEGFYPVITMSFEYTTFRGYEMC